MSTVITLLVILMITMLPTASCGSSENSFDRECGAIQKIMAVRAHLATTVDPKRTGNATEASWQYEIIGGVKDAKKAIRDAVTKDYELVREDDAGLSYPKFDGYDSFYLSFVFQTKDKNSMSVSVVLKSMPD